MSAYSSPYLNPHQTRTHEPTDWQFQLADAIESAFAKGAHELDDLVSALNSSRVRPLSGSPWTVEVFTDLMRELGA